MSNTKEEVEPTESGFVEGAGEKETIDEAAPAGYMGILTESETEAEIPVEYANEGSGGYDSLFSPQE